MNKGLVLVVLLAVVALASIYVIFSVTGNAIRTQSYQCSDGKDNDGDGYCDYSIKRCSDGSIPGDVDCLSRTDNREAPDCFPETCNGRDDDCDGTVDEGLGSISCGVGACYGTVPACLNATNSTCIPGTPYPEICNSVDDDCDGTVDEGSVCSTCIDSDGGFNVLVSGTVTGLRNGTTYNMSDFCIGNVTLTEFYCSGTGYFASNYSCTGVNHTSCSFGRCI